MVTYRLNDGQGRPAVVVKAKEGKADLFVFLTPNDHGKGIHENHVRRGFAQLKDVTEGDGILEFSYSRDAIPDAIVNAQAIEVTRPAGTTPTAADLASKKKTTRRKR